MALNSYIERLKAEPMPKKLDAVWHRLIGFISNKIPRQWLYLFKAARIYRNRQKFESMDDKALKQVLAESRELAMKNHLEGVKLQEAMGALCEASKRSKAMFPYKVQGADRFMAAGGNAKTAVGGTWICRWRRNGCSSDGKRR